MPGKPSGRPPSRNGETGGRNRTKDSCRNSMRSWIGLAFVFLALAAGAWFIFSRHSITSRRTYLQGIVLDESGPISGATVRFQGDPHIVLSKSDGIFELPNSPKGSRQITAWKEGYLIAGAPSDAQSLTLQLKSLPTKD